MQKTIFVIRGFRLNSTMKDPLYAPFLKGLKDMGYRVVPVDITWNHKTVSSFAKQFKAVYEKHKTEHNTILGSSLGAMVALVAATKLHPDVLILSSLSALFKEDIPKYDIDKTFRNKRFGLRRNQDFKKLSVDALAAEINRLQITTILVYGEFEKNEFPRLVERVLDTGSKIHGATVHEIKGTSHYLREQSYQQPFLKIIKKL